MMQDTFVTATAEISAQRNKVTKAMLAMERAQNAFERNKKEVAAELAKLQKEQDHATKRLRKRWPCPSHSELETRRRTAGDLIESLRSTHRGLLAAARSVTRPLAEAHQQESNWLLVKLAAYVDMAEPVYAQQRQACLVISINIAHLTAACKELDELSCKADAQARLAAFVLEAAKTVDLESGQSQGQPSFEHTDSVSKARTAAISALALKNVKRALAAALITIVQKRKHAWKNYLILHRISKEAASQKGGRRITSTKGRNPPAFVRRHDAAKIAKAAEAYEAWQAAQPDPETAAVAAVVREVASTEAVLVARAKKTKTV
jgi:hypothetical protein